MIRKERLISELCALIEDGSGIEMAGVDPGTGFLELGLDSLFLTQFALTLQQKYGVKITFRQLMEQLGSVSQIAERLDAALPAETAPEEPKEAPVDEKPAAVAPPVQNAAPRAAAPAGSVQAVIDQQLQLMAQQLAVLAGRGGAAKEKLQQAQAALAQKIAAVPAVAPAQQKPTEPADEAAAAAKYDPKKAFGAIARIHASASQELTARQQARLDAFIRRYTARTRKSKEFTQANRAKLADPRVVSGFKPFLKELVYQVVVDRSKGCRMWDLDGNEYVDVLSGFGSNYFGNQPQFVLDALKEQLERGYEVGPQHPLAAECAELVCDLTGFDRAAFCNTGSEAVMGCMRVARTVTGRKLIALFAGSYHGIFDEVIVRGTRKLRSIPAAPGIMPSTVENVLVLDYGTPESLEILRSRANELAAVLVEPIQSRRPDFQPREFLQEVRKLTAESGTALIFDEVITGFRLAQGGAQEYFGIRADLASYGKVIGGGLPVGVIAGKREWMDALDGGHWQYGDGSVPTVGVTYFAGTFVRHPLALAACKASLQFLKEKGPSLQMEQTARTSAFVARMNGWFKEVGAPLELRTFGTLWKTFFTEEQPFGELIFAFMRDRGVHILDGFPCFFTLAHGDADIAAVEKAFQESVLEAQESGFLPEGRKPAAVFDAASPPVPGARLGRDPSGNPAWYVPSPDAPGRYVKV